MMARCVYCAELTIERLIKLAKKQFDPALFPQKYYYKHQPSLHHLEASALGECDICRMILDCLKDTPMGSDWRYSDHKSGTMYSEAKFLRHSNIKLCIKSSHYSASSESKGKLPDTEPVLDVIIVHIGQVSAYEDQISDEDSNEGSSRAASSVTSSGEFNELKLVLISAKGQIPRVGSHQIGRFQVDSDLNSSSNHAMARNWFHECEKNHPGCWPDEINTLPTRVVDVGRDPNDAVRLVCSQDLRAKFAALSHCWGGPIEPVLQKSNLDQFQTSIPYSSLATNFRDAITITRNLGLRYIWIDSLCIIQDSRSDWEQESSKMASVYHDAAVTIFATSSKGSTEGILNKRPPIPVPKGVELKVSSNCNVTVMASKLDDDFDENLWRLSWSSPLARRGWTLQEHILSPRSLFYGAYGIYWQCLQESHAPDGLTGGVNLFPDESPLLYSVLRSPSILMNPKPVSHPRMLFEDYYRTIQTYSWRALTAASDKLPAISAVASALSQELARQGVPATYLAGLWDTDLVNGLMWHQEMNDAPHVSVYRAPSWSWAVTDHAVLFDSTFNEDNGGSLSWRFQVHGHEIELSNPQNPFGMVTSGRLVVESLTMRLIRSRQMIGSQTSNQKSVGWGGYDDIEYENSQPKKPFGDPGIFQYAEQQEVCLITLCIARPEVDEYVTEIVPDEKLFSPVEYKIMLLHFTDEPESERVAAQGIIVLQRQDCEYERVGHVSSINIEYSWFKSWKREMLTLV